MPTACGPPWRASSTMTPTPDAARKANESSCAVEFDATPRPVRPSPVTPGGASAATGNRREGPVPPPPDAVVGALPPVAAPPRTGVHRPIRAGEPGHGGDGAPQGPQPPGGGGLARQ